MLINIHNGTIISPSTWGLLFFYINRLYMERSVDYIVMKQTTQPQRYKQLHNNLITESLTQDARCKMVQLSQDSNKYRVLHFGNFFPLGRNSCELRPFTYVTSDTYPMNKYYMVSNKQINKKLQYLMECFVIQYSSSQLSSSSSVSCSLLSTSSEPLITSSSSSSLTFSSFSPQSSVSVSTSRDFDSGSAGFSHRIGVHSPLTISQPLVSEMSSYSSS